MYNVKFFPKHTANTVGKSSDKIKICGVGGITRFAKVYHDSVR